MKINRVLRCTALLLAVSMFSQSIAFARKPLDVWRKVSDIGMGQQCRVKLVDGTQVKGKIVSIHPDNLTLKTEGVQEPRRIDYAQITAVKRLGISDDAKLVIVVSVGIGVICALLFWLGNALGT
jgi:hypothetical protein